MAHERELDLIHDRLLRLEGKVDKLLTFRAWTLGAIAAVSLVMNVVFEWVLSRWPH